MQGDLSVLQPPREEGPDLPPSSAGIKGRGLLGSGDCVCARHTRAPAGQEAHGEYQPPGGLTVHGSPVLCANTVESNAIKGSFFFKVFLTLLL